MTLPNYEDHEEEFLKAIATRFGFSGKTWWVFLERFREKNTDSLDKDIAAYLEAELIEGTSDGANPATILRDRLKVICDKFEVEGCDFQGVTKGRWKIAKRWLREVIYPEWLKQCHLIPLTCDQLWQQLWETATPTDKLKPVLLEPVSGLDMGEAEMTEEDSFSFRLNSRIRFEVNLDSAGYLLLLEKGTSGKMWCLCPSGFAPELKHLGGWVSLPQASSRHKYFKLTGSAGQEEIVAVITKDVPRLDWLPKPGERLLQLREGHLTGLLEYLNLARDYQVLRMVYRVTAA
ncbi:MAG: DUF4384 domain-containing protein [Symplocastrum torsivum CPER-KK1]|jgi:hypothetical protein|uniref:DUF4384 domain-containing protein n=1 Tax=Symplocastrum torsivum CPER-KK1 TaxID=450513 RepID=A0A951PL92_9CYAN|nr:DUF4384 domain-containing protein [Symplocastrum torsivum CPER-KK1]